MGKLKLLITDKIDETQITPLLKFFEIETKVGIQPQDLSKIIGDCHCLVTRSSTAVPRGLIERGKNLKIIARAGIGVDNIDIFTATERKIAVINAPRGNARVTAEHTIGLLFALLRHIPQAVSDLKKGIWGKQKYIGTQIAGKTLGIVGFGNVGQEVYRIAVGIGLKVVVCEPYVRLPKRLKKVTFDELLKISDIVSLHVPSTYLTYKMINKNTLALCRDRVYIINCSRGVVVDEEAIIKALVKGKVAGFGVDVYTREPQVNPKLLQLSNVVATPHIAGSTLESQRESVAEVAVGILSYIQGKVPSNLLNPQVFKKSVSTKTVVSFNFDAVIFDCDSTISGVEGIDELAELVGEKKEVSRLTQMAMEGEVSFEKIYEERLKIIKPTRKQLDYLGQLYVQNLIEDAKEVVEALRFLGKEVFLVSGGYTAALLHLGKALGIPEKNIFGNDLLFDAKGNYVSFIEGPLRRNYGKLQIIRQVPGKKVFIGDSVTDLETKECVDLFVGYGGVVKRARVEEQAEIYLKAASLAPILIIAAGFEGCVKLLSTKYRRFVGKGIDLLSHSLHVKLQKSVLPRLAAFKQLAYY